jgi:integrase
MARPKTLPPGLSNRGKAYVYDWRDASGHHYQRKAGDTVEEAIAYKTRIDAELNAGVFVPGSRVRFDDYARQWIETHPLKEQTRERYRSILRAHVTPYFGALPLARITPPTCREWLHRQSRLGLADNSLRQHIAVLKSVMKSARADGHIAALPTDGLRVPRQVKRRPRVLTAREALSLVEATPPAWCCAVAVAVFGGLRLGEVLALTCDDVDLGAGVLHVAATLSEVNGRTPRMERETPKSDAGLREVPIVEPLADLLRRHVRDMPPGQDLLFVSATGGYVSKSNFYRDVWRPTRGAAGFATLHFHDLRHTAASLLLAYSGAQLSELKAILGHSQIAHTVDLYGHLLPGRLDAIRAQFGAALLDVMGASGSRPAIRGS